MNNFYDAFKEAWKQCNIKGAPLLINQLDKSKNREYNYICLVEGSTDSKFYMNIKNEPFGTNKKIFFINMIKSNYDIDNRIVGKKGVITNYKIIKENQKLNKYLNMCIFIVDHDYDGISDKRLTFEEKNCFTITSPYAFENYFLEPENLKRIFSYFYIKKSFSEFHNKFNTFLKELYEYNRLCSSITATYNEGGDYYTDKHPNYKKSIEFKECLSKFNFLNDDEYYDKNLLSNELKKMKDAVEKHEKAKKYYEKKSFEYKDFDKYNGHIIFQFLSDYLSQCCNKNMYIFYKEIVGKLSVDINIKNGLGNPINKTQ